MSENRSGWGTALAGGVVGAILAIGIFALAAPSLMGERIVRQALTSNPELLVEASAALRNKQASEQLDPIRARLEAPFHSSWKGAAQPKVVMTYFYDYACGYCRQSNPAIEQLLKENPDLRVVYRELPILGPDSVAASRVALTASRAGKFAQYHDALYAAGRPSPETIMAAAKAAGITPQPTSDPALEAELQSNMALASQLGATGTPLFVIGNQVVNSAVGYEGLKQAIEEARKA